MKKKLAVLLCIITATVISVSFKNSSSTNTYETIYRENLDQFRNRQLALLQQIESSDLSQPGDIINIKAQLQQARFDLKGMDIWLRYLEPTVYKKINGPLPVEWETEVFEKFEKPYKREGAGLTLAYLQLEDTTAPSRESLRQLITQSIQATKIYEEDSITGFLSSYHHFFLCNRLYLLNLAAIYTTGFECPDTEQIIPELRSMLSGVTPIYTAFNNQFPATPLNTAYLSLYEKTVAFVQAQPRDFQQFDHFRFIRDYINPLFRLNQQMIQQYRVITKSTVDYALTKEALSIFDKSLYNGQNAKGIYFNVIDEDILAEIDKVGKSLFYDPILSGNNERSCASCHQSTAFFTDTVLVTSLQFDKEHYLPRNTPSLINTPYNHLIMLDGKHISLQDQTHDVMHNPNEMGSKSEEILQKVMSCTEYSKVFKKLLAYTPQEPELSIAHISSAITYYYSKFSAASSPFDDAMNQVAAMDEAAVRGFNLFMSKAQCGTCHFVPQFNGVKPPYVGSEFEVLGVPADTAYQRLSADRGRYNINPAKETDHAFRTGTLRNAAHTMPYMHNGVFTTLDAVIDFYNTGGGSGHGLDVPNQTLAADSLGLSAAEKHDLIRFIHTLTERIPFEAVPKKLPASANKLWNNRKPGGLY